MKYEIKVTGKVVQSADGGMGAVYKGEYEGAEEHIGRINDAIEADYEDLAQYIGDRDNLEAIESIARPKAVEPVSDKFVMIWEVLTERELTEDEQKALVDYIEGQSSDGWGEGFEQRAIASRKDEVDTTCEDCQGAGCDECGGKGYYKDDEIYE